MVRLWLEEGRQSAPSWRGRVKHVQGDRQAYFRTLDELRSFVEQVSGVVGPPAAPAPETARHSDEDKPQ
ncbi:MAG: hypothetical protein KIS96_00140 [Bauldia sp.]|nr:hypothetical protein [Bauldia sp.]